MVKFQYHNVFPISKGDIQSIPLYRACEIINGKHKNFDMKSFIIKNDKHSRTCHSIKFDLF